MKHILLLISCLLASVWTTFPTHAKILLPRVLGDNMVLQQKQPVPVWGQDIPGTRVVVHFAGQKAFGIANSQGKWKVSLRPMKASATPETMTIIGTDTCTLNNILVGEVWLCSGQSNMDWMISQLKADKSPENDNPLGGPGENDPLLRLFKVEKRIEGSDVVTNGWHPATPEQVLPFSAVAFYFGRELRDALNVPIGLIHSSWGGSRIEPWTDPAAYRSAPAFAKEAALRPMVIDGMEPGINFQGMIQPMIPFAIKGAIWYQGESNLMIHDGWRYADKMQVLIEGWRKKWGYDFPFYYVQLAPYLYSARKDALKHPADYLPLYWEIQQAVQAIPNTGMVFITDLVNDLSNIHPIRKHPVGKRLSLWALAKTYGIKGIEYRSPEFKAMRTRGSTVEVEFAHTAGGLVCSGEEPLWFSIAGEDGVFFPAKATLNGDKVTLSSPEVPAPKQVRYAWDEKACTNLSGKTGLPVAPFRSKPERWKPRHQPTSGSGQMVLIGPVQ